MHTRIKKVRSLFSIVELLVVVAIIVLLISIMEPALNKALSQARTAICINNNKQLVTAVRIYTDDYKTVMPFSSWASLSMLNGQSRSSWAYQFPYWTSIEEGLKKSQIYPYLKKVEVWRCPEDEGSANGYLGTNKITSYLMNGSVNGYGRKRDQYRTNEFRGSDMMLFEISEDSHGGLWNDASSYPNEIHDSLPKRHYRQGINAYFDGSVKAIPTEEYLDLLFQYPGPLWSNPGVATGR